MSAFIAPTSLVIEAREGPGGARTGAMPSTEAPREPGAQPGPPCAGPSEARGGGLLRPDEGHPVVHRKGPLDQPPERRDDRRLHARALDRAGEDRHGLERLDGLAHTCGD